MDEVVCQGNYHTLLGLFNADARENVVHLDDSDCRQ